MGGTKDLSLQSEEYGLPLLEENQVLMEIKTSQAMPLWLVSFLEEHHIRKTLDYDRTPSISNATFIGTGAAQMVQSFSDAKQGVIAVQVTRQNAQTPIQLLDGNGKVLLEQTPVESYEVIILSSPQIQSGKTYTLKVGEASEEVTAK